MATENVEEAVLWPPPTNTHRATAAPKNQKLLKNQNESRQQVACFQQPPNGHVGAIDLRGKWSRQMLRIERDSDGETSVIRLIGRIQAEHLDELKTQVRGTGLKPILDLKDVTLVDVQVVRFLDACLRGGIELRNCPPYIREWMLRERSGNRWFR